MMTLLWILAVLFILIGVAGTLIPALPGVPLILIGVLIGAWIDDFQRISAATVVVMVILTVLGVVIDYVAAALSAGRAGASRARRQNASARNGLPAAMSGRRCPKCRPLPVGCYSLAPAPRKPLPRRSAF